MKRYLKPLTRRQFLKAGAVGGVVIATTPIWDLFSYSAPPADFYVNPVSNLSKETLISRQKIIGFEIRWSPVFCQNRKGHPISFQWNALLFLKTVS